MHGAAWDKQYSSPLKPGLEKGTKFEPEAHSGDLLTFFFKLAYKDSRVKFLGYDKKK